jgi:sec-independent protein translocase protein TatA
MRLQIWHIVVLVIAFVLLFGWKNLPNVARSLGESMRVFKSEVDQMKDENQARKDGQPGEGATTTPGATAVTDTAQQEYRRLEQHRDGQQGTDPRP